MCHGTFNNHKAWCRETVERNYGTLPWDGDVNFFCRWHHPLHAVRTAHQLDALRAYRQAWPGDRLNTNMEYFSVPEDMAYVADQYIFPQQHCDVCKELKDMAGLFIRQASGDLLPIGAEVEQLRLAHHSDMLLLCFECAATANGCEISARDLRW